MRVGLIRTGRLLAPLVGVLALGIGCASHRPPPPRPAVWQTVESSTCALRFEMPGPPRRDSDPPKAGFARAEGYHLTLGVPYGYDVLCGSQRTHPASRAEIDDWLREMSWNKPAELLSTSAFTVGECPGLESRVRIMSPSGRAADVVIRRYAPPDRYVVVLATTADDPSGRAIVARFLDSLVIEGCAPPP